MDRIAAYERRLTRYAVARLREVAGVRIVGYEGLTDQKRLAEVPKGSVLSFVCEGLHPHDVGTLLDRFVRAKSAGGSIFWTARRRTVRSDDTTSRRDGRR